MTTYEKHLYGVTGDASLNAYTGCPCIVNVSRIHVYFV